MSTPANPYLEFGVGSDPIAVAALVAALALTALFIVRPRLTTPNASYALGALALLAALLSTGYVAYYLRGGPRIVDAAHYFLEARTFAAGHFAFDVSEPLASFNGRFLLSVPGRRALGVLFPPGYPAALALAFLAGAPMALGPCLAAALVVATFQLARTLGLDVRASLMAAALSALSAALRYHTADTMSHGFAALLVVSAMIAVLSRRRGSALLAGLCAGWLLATRPVSGACLVVALAGFVVIREKRLHRLLAFIVGLAPGVMLLLAYQRALTGDALRSTQFAYYAVADGPPGCFRYGFGRGIGCLFEHGEYVRARLPAGYGVVEALKTTSRRVLVHLIDVANFAPLALAVPVGALRGRHERGVLLVASSVVALVLAYAPFYFEASYPGGGARLFADVLPLEHVLIARALAGLPWARFALPLSLAGFALHASHQHRALRDREGGRPMFEARVLRAAHVERGLVLVSTDHGFALGHDPRITSARDGVVVARYRGDALDALLWETLGRPPVYRYRYDASARLAEPMLEAMPLDALAPGDPRRVEAEHLWPPSRVRGGWVQPTYSPQGCCSSGRVLQLITPSNEERALEVSLRAPRMVRGAQIRFAAVGVPPVLAVRATRGGLPSWISVQWQSVGTECWRSLPVPTNEGWNSGELTLSAGPGLLDYIEYASDPAEKGVDN